VAAVAGGAKRRKKDGKTLASLPRLDQLLTPGKDLIQPDLSIENSGPDRRNPVSYIGWIFSEGDCI
jgi:hypothetical protein